MNVFNCCFVFVDEWWERKWDHYSQSLSKHFLSSLTSSVSISQCQVFHSLKSQRGSLRDGDMLMVLDPVSAVGIMDDCSCVIFVQTWVKQAQNEWRKTCFCDAKTHQPTSVTWTATCLSWPLLTGSPEQINLEMLSLCLSLRRLELLMCIWENEIWVMVSIKGSRRPPLGSIYSDTRKCPSYVIVFSVWVLSVCFWLWWRD